MKRVSQFLHQQTPCKWLFYGDSITHGAFHTGGRRDYTQLFAEKVRFSESRCSDIVINTAVSGNTTRQLLEEFEWRVAQFSPHVVFLMIGMNDCANQLVPPAEYEDNLSQLVQRMEDLSAQPVLQTTSPIVTGFATSREPYFPKYMEIVRSVAASRKLPLIDHTAHWLGQRSFPLAWMSDAFHPNAEGHQAMYDLLWQNIDQSDEADKR